MMQNNKIAIVGIGATGTVLAAALLSKTADLILVDPRPDLEKVLKKNGISVSGAFSYQVPVHHYYTQISAIGDFKPNIIFISTKTFHLPRVIDELKAVFKPGTKIIATQNGLGPEDLIAEKFGTDAVFRISLNYGATLVSAGKVESAFFNRPNHLGSLTPQNQKSGLELAELLTSSGLDTEFVDDIKLYVWKKMIMKCTMASICAVTDRTIKGALGFRPTREIAENCFREAIDVARAMGYDMGADYLKHALGYLEKVGEHKDSMCQDIASKAPTEIDFLGGKIVEYGRAKGIPTPFYVTMTNLVKAFEDSYSSK
ncbi:ketopantoate reductase family protein [Thermodesulfobacteriota bacterium]